MSAVASSPTAGGVVFAAFRLGWGVTLVAMPGRIVTAVGGDNDPRSRTVVRILGARHVLQAVVEAGAGPRLRRLGSVVDVLHALSALGLAGVDRRWRRPALLDAAVASGFAAVNAVQT